MRMRGSVVLVVSALALLPSCGGGNSAASVASFCTELRADAAQLNHGPAANYAQLIAAFDRLQRMAPEAIKGDVVTVDAAVKTTQGNVGRALSTFLSPSYSTAVGHLTAYAKSKCGIELTTHQSVVKAPPIHVTLQPTPRPGRANADLPDPCTLVPEATVSALFGSSASKEKSVGTLGRQCHWEATEDNRTQSLSVWVVGDPFFYEASIHPHARALTGLGDRAFVDTSSILPSVLVSVQKHTTVLQLTYNEHSAPGPVDMSTTAGKLIAIAKRVVHSIS